ncbi:response regulator transcription factor [Temperatibacter marinus]|uniref:Response regulator transcription factor n=1 Tax=Temperatibacter marinus TaxID=1456591 RepID=A0AA52HA03_9PROT|nr:response regulator transcription factor [Temperatibacter marinus]WND03459.1 response regulator transcription factor [Temperatibacter marinus]
MAKQKILLVDDDNDLREGLADQLDLLDEFSISQASGACMALEIIEENSFDLMIFDVDMPDMDGRELCKRVRKKGVTVPIIMLTGMDGDADTILGLESGANDYVAKPFSFTVLLARIRAQFRQFAQSEDATFSVGPYKFRPGTRELDLQDGLRPLKLTEKETNILRFLLKAQGEAVSREELLSEVWGYNSGITTHTLETHIYRLRQKIEKKDDQSISLILTEPGGYALNKLAL